MTPTTDYTRTLAREIRDEVDRRERELEALRKALAALNGGAKRSGRTRDAAKT